MFVVDESIHVSVTLTHSLTDQSIVPLAKLAAKTDETTLLYLSGCVLKSGACSLGSIRVAPSGLMNGIVYGYCGDLCLFGYNVKYDRLTWAVDMDVREMTLHLDFKYAKSISDDAIKLTESKTRMPERNEVWQHHEGGIYRILNLGNRNPKPGWETTVVYCKDHDPDTWYTRTLKEFLTKFTIYNGK